MKILLKNICKYSRFKKNVMASEYDISFSTHCVIFGFFPSRLP